MIELKNITKVFDPRAIAGLHSVDLKLNRGEVLALLGPNGSGKTTLAKIIAGDIHPDRGTVQTSGPVHFFKMRDLPPNEVVQKYLLNQISITIDEEKKIQLTRDLASLFEFTFQLRQSTQQLSQGQRQKVMLAAELINSPTIIIMDEPFAHLDPFSRRDILKLLFEYFKQKEMAIFWITHDKEEAFEFAETIALLHHGRLEQVGKKEDFLKRPKNLFVASYLGHKNFYALKKSTDGWITPWGKIESDLKFDEAYLVIPPGAIELNSQKGVAAQLKSCSCGPLFWTLESSFDQHTFTHWSYRPKESSRTTLYLDVRLEDCFLIPL